MRNKQKKLKSEDIYKSSGKFYKRSLSVISNFLEDKSFHISLPIDSIPRSSFHLDSTFIPLAIEELPSMNYEDGEKLQKLLLILESLSLSVPTTVTPFLDNSIDSQYQYMVLRTPRKCTIHHEETISTPLQSPLFIRHSLSHDNAVAVKPDMIWYESYVSIEPVPDGMIVDRNEKAVRCEFQHILSNVYISKTDKSRLKKRHDELNVCSCLPPMKAYGMLEHPNTIPSDYSREDIESFSRHACGDRCINRLCYCECDPSTCPCGDDCSNQMFRKKEYQKLILFYTPKKGWGIKAPTFIPKGTFIIEYVGEVISEKESELRRQRRQGQLHMYYMSLGPDQLIDATEKGNASRFINHSCDPNCETQKWTTGRTSSIGIFAVRDIQKGEELTFDYQFERIGNASMPCFCGSPKCRHMLGKNKEFSNVNNLPLEERINRNRLFQCDCTMDMIDMIVMPTTLLPFVCKGLVKDLTSYLSTFNLNSLPSSQIILRKAQIKKKGETCCSSFCYKPEIVVIENDIEEESEDSLPMGFHRFSSRGCKRPSNTSLLLNRNISDGLKRFCWVYDKKNCLRLGIVDSSFKNTVIKKEYGSVAQ